MTDTFSDSLLKLVPKLRVHAWTLTRSRVTAEDLVQDTLVAALAARATFEPSTNLAGWTHAILPNRFISTLRKRRQTVDLEAASETAFLVAGAQEDSLVLKELARAMARLAPDQREALTMAVVLGMSYEEIAAVINCAEGTAKSKVFRARQRLRAMLLGEERQADEASAPAGGRYSKCPAKHRGSLPA